MAEINIPRLKVSDSFVEWRNKFNQSLDAVQELSNSTGGGGGGAPAIAIKDEGITVTEQPISMNFTGPAVEVTSDIAGNVVVNITATGGGTDPSITPATIETPTIISPAGGSVTGGFSTSEFLVLAEEDYHKSSDWQISQFSDFSVVEYELLDTKVYKRTLSIPIGILDVGTTYYIRVRHRGFTASSAYSNGVMFVAEAPINRLLRYNGESSTPQIFFERDGMLLAYDTIFEYILRSTDGVNFDAVYKMTSVSSYGNFCYNTVTQRYVFITETRYVESVDGLNWVSDTAHNMNQLLGVMSKVIWSERLSRYIAVGGSSYSGSSAAVGMLLTSTNGISWTRPTNYVVNGFIQDVVDTGVNIVYMGLATFATAANRPVYSTDLTTFTITASTMSDLGDPQAIVHAGGGTLYFVTNNNANTWRSIDHGVTWSLFAQPSYTSQVTMFYTNFGSKVGNKTVFVTAAGHVEFDETSIIHRDSALPPRYIASFGGVHRLYDASPRNVRTYDNGVITTIRNIDSIQFTSFWHQNCINVATDGNVFVISRNSTQINVSTDSTGEFWRAVNFNETIFNVFYRNGLFIAFSNASTFTSIDGYNWSGAVPIGGGTIGLSTTTNIVSLEWIPQKSMYVGVVGRRTSKTSTTTEYYLYSFNGTEWFRGTQISVNGFGSFYHYDAENLLISTAPTPQLHYHSSPDGINWSQLYFRGLNDKIISNGRMYVCKQNGPTGDFGVYRDKPESRLFFNTRLIQTTTNFIGFLEGFIPNQIIAVNFSGSIYIINTLDDTFTVSSSGLGNITRIYRTPTRIFLATGSTIISSGSNFVWSAQRAFTSLDSVTEINGVFTFYGNTAAIYTTDFVTYTNCTNSAGSFSSSLQDGNFAIAISNNGDIRTTNDGISFTLRASGPQQTGYSSSSSIKVPGKGYFIGGSTAGYAAYSVDGLNWSYTTSFGNQNNSFIYPPVYSDFYGAYIAAVNSGISSYGTGLVVFDNLVPTIVSSLTADPSVYLIHGQILTYAGMTFSIYYSSRVNAIANSSAAASVDINLISGYLQGKQVSSTFGNGSGSIFSNSNDHIILSAVSSSGFRKRWNFNPFYSESVITTPSFPSYNDIQFVYDTGSHIYIGANSNCVFINKTTNQITSVDTIDNTKNSIDIRDIAFSNSATLLTSFTGAPNVGYYLGQTPL